MEILGILLSILGLLAWLGGTVMLLVAAWRANPLWLFAVLCVPLGGLLFVIVHFSDAKYGFFTRIAGIVLIVIAGTMLDGVQRERAVSLVPTPRPAPTAPPGGWNVDDVLGPRDGATPKPAKTSGPIDPALARSAAENYLVLVRTGRFDEADRYLPAPLRASSKAHAAWWKKQGNLDSATISAVATSGTSAQITITVGPRSVQLVASGNPKSPSIHPSALSP